MNMRLPVFFIIASLLSAISAGAEQNFRSMACGNVHSMVLTTNGDLWAWGDNDYGQLGDGTSEQKNSPVMARHFTGVVAVAAGRLYSLAVHEDGTVSGWGCNTYGQLGNGTSSQTNMTPTTVSGMTSVVSVVGGESHSVALLSDGTVRAWGYNYMGQCGNGSGESEHDTPVQVSGLSNVIQIASCGGNHTLALKSDGTVWAWGHNYFGQLGVGCQCTRTVPVQVWTITNIAAIAAGACHSMALGNDGTVWCWGHNYQGQCGDGAQTHRLSPVQTTGMSNAVKIVSGGWHCFALDSENSWWGWGSDQAGEMGDGLETNYYEPIELPQLSGMTNIVSMSSHCLGVTTSGVVYSWGDNSCGQVGDGTETDRLTPLAVLGAGSAGTLMFDSSSYTGTQGSVVTVLVSRCIGSSGDAGVEYDTVDGTATAGVDYVSTSGTLSWTNGETSARPITVTINSGAARKSSFTVVLTNATGATLGSPYSATVEIAESTASRIPVYRLYSYGAAESTYEHLWTTSEAEKDTLDSWPSWEYEGIAWYAYTNQESGSTPLYRLYASSVKQHHYTIDTSEYSLLAGNGTWTGEGTQYYVYSTSSETGLVPAYRFYHATMALHHFTIDETEKASITNHPEWGYVYEGIGYYVFATNVAGSGIISEGSRFNIQDCMAAKRHKIRKSNNGATGPSVSLTSNTVCRINAPRTGPLQDRERAEPADGDRREFENISILSTEHCLLNTQVIPVPGDYDGDGIEDIAYYKESTGTWFVPLADLDVQCSMFSVQCSPSSSYSLQPADYSLSPASSSPYSLRFTDYGLLQWGGPEFIPVSMDYDGDGISDLAVMHKQTETWFILALDGRILLWDGHDFEEQEQ